MDPNRQACDAYRAESGWDADPDAMRVALRAAAAVIQGGGLARAVDVACEAYSQELGRDANPWAMRAAVIAAGLASD